MGKIIFIAFAAVFFIGILRSPGPKRLLWFFTGLLFFQDKIVLFETPTLMSFHRFLIFSLLFAELIDFKEFYRQLKEFPLIKPLLIVLVGMVCIGIFDPRHPPLLNVYRITDQYIQRFFIIFLCYVNFKRSSDWKMIFDFFLIAAIISCMYGFYVFVTRSNPYDNYITVLYNSISEFDQYALDQAERFRVNSFVTHPIYYGYVLGLFLLLSFCHVLHTNRLKIVHQFALVIIFLNLILTNSRTPLISTAAGFTAFIVIALTKKAKIDIVVYGVFVCLLVYNVPFIQEKINNSIDIFQTGGQKTNGSSIAMRTKQLTASIKEFKKGPFFGNGFYYIQENLGFVNILKNKSDSDFQGFESYIYELLIEQGSVGILVNIIFFVSVGRFFLKKIRVSKHFAGMGFSILIMFLVFIIGTGTLGSWAITMGLLGIIVGSLNYTEKFIEMESQLVAGALSNQT